MKLALILCVVFACVTIVAVGQTQPVLKFEYGHIRVVGFPLRNGASVNVISHDQWNTILSVYTHEAYQRNIDQPVAGKYEWNGDTIFFRPTYSFAPGETYQAVFNPKAFFKNDELKTISLWEKSELSFTIPADVHPLTAVESIYPESATLPENLLRMYIYFLLR